MKIKIFGIKSMMKRSDKPCGSHTADFICNILASRPFLLLSDKNGASLGRSPIPRKARKEVDRAWLSGV